MVRECKLDAGRLSDDFAILTDAGELLRILHLVLFFRPIVLTFVRKCESRFAATVIIELRNVSFLKYKEIAQ